MNATRSFTSLPEGLQVRGMARAGYVSVVLPGVAEAVPVARALAMQAAGTEFAVSLVVSELVTNALQHSRSGLPGGHLHLVVHQAGEVVLVSVLDEGASTGQAPAEACGELAEHGRGLAIAAALGELSAGGLFGGRLTRCLVTVEPAGRDAAHDAVRDAAHDARHDGERDAGDDVPRDTRARSGARQGGCGRSRSGAFAGAAGRDRSGQLLAVPR